MMLDELIVEQQFRRTSELDRGRLAMEAEARAFAAGPGVRARMALALVSAGAWLDRNAVERARPVARPRTKVTGPTSRW